LAVAVPTPLALVAVRVNEADSRAPASSAAMADFGSLTVTVSIVPALRPTAFAGILKVFDLPLLVTAAIEPVNRADADWSHRTATFNEPRSRFVLPWATFRPWGTSVHVGAGGGGCVLNVAVTG